MRNNLKKAIGDNGQTPEFRISGEGYWQMRIGEGEFADVLDENGNRVKATPEGDQEGSDGLFENVEVRRRYACCNNERG